MKLIGTSAAPKSPAIHLRVSLDGTRAFVQGLNWNVEPMRTETVVWDVGAGTSKLTKLSPKIRAVQFAADGTLVAHDETTVSVLALPSGKPEKQLPWPSGPGALAPTEFTSIQGTDDGIALFDEKKQRWAYRDKAYTRWTTILWATPELFVVGSEHPKKTLSVHDANDGSLIVRNAVAQISDNVWLAPGGSRLVNLASTLKPAVLIDVATGESLKRPLLKKGLTSFAFSPTGAVLAAAGPDSPVLFFGSDVTKKIGELPTKMRSPLLAWLPDGATLLVVDHEDGAMERWDVSELDACAPAPQLADALGGKKAKAPAKAASVKIAAPKVDVGTRGTLSITLTRPASTLAQHLGSIKEVLGHALPKDVAAFYAQSDGVSYAAVEGKKSLGLDETLLGVAALFDEFKAHRQFKTVAAYEKADENGEISELPFYGDVWSDDFDIHEKGALAHFNALVRSKQLVRIAGRSEAIVIDFSPPKGKAAYQLAIAHRGAQFFPLELTFKQFVENFEKFGATTWYLAYLTPAAIKEWNIDPVPTVEQDLKLFAKAFPDEVAAILARAKKR
ncbi:MAG TPA: WD40 repeat domain-containing protein [Kofleriaceae bacterium]|jgi:WD40 repeat protein